MLELTIQKFTDCVATNHTLLILLQLTVQKFLYGLLKEPDLNIPLEEEEEQTEEDGDKPYKRLTILY